MKPFFHYHPVLIILLLLLFLPAANVLAGGIEDMKASTVRILCRDKNNENVFTGSGFVVGDGGNVVTNNHVVACGSDVNLVVLLPGRKNAVAEIVWTSERKDLAVLSINGIGRPVKDFVISDNVKDAETVYAMGFPGDADDPVDEEDIREVKVTKGIVSAKIKLNNGTMAYQTDAAINGGNSGGPLFDEEGRLVGINVAKIAKTGVEGIGYSIRADELLPELQRLRIPFNSTVALGPHASPDRHEAMPDLPEGVRSSNVHLIVSVCALAVILSLTAIFLVVTGKGRKISRRSKEAITSVFTCRVNPNPAVHASHPAKPVLRGISGQFNGNAVELGNETIVLGRDHSRSNLVYPPNCHEVGRIHCSVRFNHQKRRFIVEDLNSTNGTFLGNGERVVPGQMRTLHHGDTFYLASRVNMFQVCLETEP